MNTDEINIDTFIEHIENDVTIARTQIESTRTLLNNLENTIQTIKWNLIEMKKERLKELEEKK
jgi:hypothetical protein